jgi:hypothetical protein
MSIGIAKPIPILPVEPTMYFSVEIEQGAAGIAEVNGRICLNEILDAGKAEPSALGAYDAGGDRMAQAQWIADGQDPFTDFQVVGGGQFEMRQILGVDFYHGDVGRFVRSEDLGFERSAVGKLYRDFFGAADHVIICEDVPVG